MFSQLEIGINHYFHQVLEPHLRLPAELLVSLGRIADEQVNLGRTLVAGVMHHVLLPVQTQLAQSKLRKGGLIASIVVPNLGFLAGEADKVKDKPNDQANMLAYTTGVAAVVLWPEGDVAIPVVAIIEW